MEKVSHFILILNYSSVVKLSQARLKFKKKIYSKNGGK